MITIQHLSINNTIDWVMLFVFVSLSLIFSMLIFPNLTLSYSNVIVHPHLPSRGSVPAAVTIVEGRAGRAQRLNAVIIVLYKDSFKLSLQQTHILFEKRLKEHKSKG